MGEASAVKWKNADAFWCNSSGILIFGILCFLVGSMEGEGSIGRVCEGWPFPTSYLTPRMDRKLFMHSILWPLSLRSRSSGAGKMKSFFRRISEVSERTLQLVPGECNVVSKTLAFPCDEMSSRHVMRKSMTCTPCPHC